MTKTICETSRSLTTALVVLMLCCGTALAQNPKLEVFVLGDSLSDPGNLYVNYGWPPSPPYAGAFSNGPVWTEYFRPPYECEIPKPEHDPDAAAALLEEAGWTDEDGDGIRECHGCEFGQEGDVMSTEFVIYSDYGESLELAQQLIAEDLKKIGMDTEWSMMEGY